MLMSIRYTWTGDVDGTRLWERDLSTKCMRCTVNVRARLHFFGARYYFGLPRARALFQTLFFDNINFHSQSSDTFF